MHISKFLIQLSKFLFQISKFPTCVDDISRSEGPLAPSLGSVVMYRLVVKFDSKIGNFLGECIIRVYLSNLPNCTTLQYSGDYLYIIYSVYKILII